MSVALRKVNVLAKKTRKKLKLLYSARALNQMYWKDDQKYNSYISNREWFENTQVDQRTKHLADLAARMDQN